MSYLEVLTARNRLTWFCSIVVVIGMSVVAIAWLAPHTLELDHPSVDIPFGIVLLIASWCSCILTTMLAGTLARDYSHLPYMWTRPIGRGRMALGYIAVDFVAILAAFTVLMAVTTLTLDALPHLHVVVGPKVWHELARAIAVPLMWYGLVEAATSWTHGRARAIVGLSWAIFWGLIILDALSFPGIIGAVIVFLNLFNPMTYLPQQHEKSLDFTIGASGMPTIPLGYDAQTVLAYTIFIVSCIVAIYAWKRMEA